MLPTTYLESKEKYLQLEESWNTLRSYIEGMSAELNNKAAVSSLFTEIKSDVTTDDAQYNHVRFLAKKKKCIFKFASGSKINVELGGKQSPNVGFQPQTEKGIVAWETTDANCNTAASNGESGGAWSGCSGV